ncbi:hypothetical protein B0J13DRAFT_567837 [Dactylonectria estremocensis]|uniref:Uncharacterized protein n=1 Tax=Dactylonectria estremocensis TaxID=1079267 RepID=A0A9P9DK25_9HYPO|nr:hypothetical protein B0J13DRAFT_567837 [Dactylonectria estremocensis]
MDWPSDQFDFTDNDLRLFQYEERESVVIQRSASEDSFRRDVLLSGEDWAEWLKTRVSKDTKTPKICFILCSRAKDLSEDEASPLSYVPFSRSTFQRILHKFRIHRTIARTVTRETAYFSSTTIDETDRPSPSTILTCRTSSAWSDDLAMALTHDPKTRTTFAIVFGCNEMHRRQIGARITAVTPAALAHPALLPGILAELERKRLTGLVEDTLDRFTLRAGGTSTVVDGQVSRLHMSEAQMGEYLELCYESQNLAKECKSVKRQLSKMTQFCDHTSTWTADSPKDELSEAESPQRGLADFGNRIKKRTLEIMDEYDNKIDECGMVLDNTSITMQTIWNHIARHDAAVNTKISRANTSIALDSKQDNAQMRSIALLTMIYLPVTAVASIFSMGIFDWSPQAGTVVSKYIWVYIVLSIALTIFTVLVWYLATRSKQKKGTDTSEELGMKEDEG